MRDRLVVIGNGMASLRFLERLTERAPGLYDVTVVGAEPQAAYNRVLLSSLLGGEVDEAACAFRGLDWYEAHGIRLITGAPVTQIDRENGLVLVGETHVLPFDKLVLAVGSLPIRLPKPGMDLPACSLPGSRGCRRHPQGGRGARAGHRHRRRFARAGGRRGPGAARGRHHAPARHGPADGASARPRRRRPREARHGGARREGPAQGRHRRHRGRGPGRAPRPLRRDRAAGRPRGDVGGGTPQRGPGAGRRDRDRARHHGGRPHAVLRSAHLRARRMRRASRPRLRPRGARLRAGRDPEPAPHGGGGSLSRHLARHQPQGLGVARLLGGRDRGAGGGRDRADVGSRRRPLPQAHRGRGPAAGRGLRGRHRRAGLVQGA